MKYFGKFQELEDIENPYDFEELNNILITQNIGRITGHENFEAKKLNDILENSSIKGLDIGKEVLTSKPLHFIIRPEIKEEIYYFFLKLFKKYIVVGNLSLYKTLVMDANVDVIGGESIAKKKDIIEKEISEIRKVHSISNDFSFKRNGLQEQLEVFDQLKKVRESLIRKLDSSIHLILLYLLGESEQIIDCYKRNDIWLGAMIDFESRLKFIVLTNYKIEVFNNNFFTSEPHLDKSISQLMGTLFQDLRPVEFLLQEINDKDLKLTDLSVLFHVLVELECLFPKKNKLFMRFLNENFEWDFQIKELKKPNFKLFKQENIYDFYMEKLSHLMPKK